MMIEEVDTSQKRDFVCPICGTLNRPFKANRSVLFPISL